MSDEAVDADAAYLAFVGKLRLSPLQRYVLLLRVVVT